MCNQIALFTRAANGHIGVWLCCSRHCLRVGAMGCLGGGDGNGGGRVGYEEGKLG